MLAATTATAPGGPATEDAIWTTYSPSDSLWILCHLVARGVLNRAPPREGSESDLHDAELADTGRNRSDRVRQLPVRGSYLRELSSRSVL